MWSRRGLDSGDEQLAKGLIPELSESCGRTGDWSSRPSILCDSRFGDLSSCFLFLRWADVGVEEDSGSRSKTGLVSGWWIL